ncbi:MAG TPA: hypothetical protein PLD10_21885 [Rhodopila sp.]|nr:hypothetical protein [Rhodopila sp.]
MRLPKLVLCGGVAALALSGIARAETTRTHSMIIRLPNGQVEQIRYTGDTPPTVVLAPDTAIAPVAVMANPQAANPQEASPLMADPFAMLRQISAAMDQQTAAMMRSISLMAPPPMPGMPGVITAAGMPGAGFAPVTIAAGPGVCMHSVQITYTGNGQPHVVSQTQGDCGPAPHQAAPAALPDTPAPAAAPHTIQVKDTVPMQNTGSPRPYSGMIHPVSTLSR